MEWLLVGLLVANLALLAYMAFGKREVQKDDGQLMMQPQQ